MPQTNPSLGLPSALLVLAACVVTAAWWWLGQPVPMPTSPIAAGEKLHCVSYAPFRGSQNPLEDGTHIEAWQIDQDLARLSRITNCVRTYSIEHGLDQIPEIARRHGMKVIHGLWLSSHADKNRVQVETTIALAKRFPDVIQSVVVGNEVLLRGEMSVTDLVNTIRGIKAQVSMPVTYADVWEFWLRHRELYDAVDFVTIHILPYWEDFPIPAREAAAHVEAIRKKVAAVFPAKEILIGETGWPSAGRMREGALPSPAEQALVIQEVLAVAKRENYRVNVIEAFDQPWKRRLEGTVGGHWGLFDDRRREFKFEWGEAVSNHPLWRWQALGGAAFAALVFAAAFAAQRRARSSPPLAVWLGVTINAAVGGVLLGWALENLPLESLGLGGWLRSLAIVAVAALAPLLGAAALTSGIVCPSFGAVLGPSAARISGPLRLALGLTLIVTSALAVQVALGLTFDPRYRDFPFAPLTAAVVPFVMLAVIGARPAGGARGVAESVTAAALALSAVYIAFNETFVNWQSVWLCAVLVALAFSLARVRDVRG